MGHLLQPADEANEIESLLAGTYTLPDTLPLSEEQRVWLQTLQAQATNTIDLDISTQDFDAHFRLMREHKASSPSGRHVGHYIMATRLKSSLFKQVYSLVAMTAVKAGVPLPRWTKGIQVMLDKGKGAHVSALRIIQLLEADLNFVLGLIWG